ncbi:MAG: hypothetical protein C0602_11500 [Denitrovibrio sp.]|nr:MAG: hypothetical protein C0602_11500 [Denitrovibrio sp.]
MSFIALEYSQTKSIVESSSNISVDHLHERYFKNCERLHEAQAIAALYYPDVSGALDEIYGQSNIFWGNQERVLQTDINKDQDLWDKHFTEVLSAINKISKDVKSVQYSIRHRATYISKSIKQIQ